MQSGRHQSNFYNPVKKVFKSLFLVSSIVILSGFNLPVFASNQGTTITELVISPQGSQVLSSIMLKVDPGNIFVGEKLTFTLGPALTASNSILSNIPCEIWIQPPNATNYVVFSGITNNLGICSYKTDQTVGQQNLVLLTQPLTPDFPRPSTNGTQTQNVVRQSSIPGSPLAKQATGGNTNLGSINGIIGGGNAFGLVLYQGNGVISNNVTYAVSGGITGIEADYPTDNGTGGGNGGGNGTGNNNSNNSNGGNNSNNNGIPGTSIFDFLPRTGGFAASIGSIIAIIILLIFLISRRKTMEEKYNQQRYKSKK